MISKTLLRKLPVNKKYLVYDSIYNYILTKYEGNNYHINVIGYRDTMYIYEKDLENLLIDARQHNSEDLEWHLENEYVYNGYTNKYKAVSGVGFINIHQDFYSFYDLSFFGEYKNAETEIELNKFKKIFNKERRKKYKDSKNQ